MILVKNLNSSLVKLADKLYAEEGLITDARKTQLNDLAHLITASFENHAKAKLIFVCTHNSRRSQLGQVWLRAAAAYFGLNGVFTFSGGTEATAFNHRMVAAIECAGFMVKKLNDTENPNYLIRLSDSDENDDIYFSKKYNDTHNPQSEFIAVMVCNDADEACPVVIGAEARISLTYLDPKAFDDTPQEAQAYDDKVMEIGREMLFVAKILKDQL